MIDRTRRALLVGNWEFPRDADHLPALKGPPHDLELLAGALTDPDTGLHQVSELIVVENADKAEIILKIEDFFGQASRDHQLLLYYTGHGQLNLLDEFYLCAKDTDTRRLVSSAVSGRDVHNIIKASSARANVVLLDCCYSGNFKGGGAQSERLSGEGRYVLTSSRPAMLTRDADERDAPSPFTAFVAQALQGAAPDSDDDGFISMEDVYEYVSHKLPAESTPQRAFDEAVGHLTVARAPGAAVADLPGAPARPRVSLRRARRAALSAAAAQRLFLAAQSSRGAGDVVGAARAFQQIIDEADGDWRPLAAMALARILVSSGDPTAAATTLRVVVADAHPSWAAEAAYELGMLLVANDDPAPAQQSLQIAIDSGHPQWAPRAAAELGALLRRQGALAAARSVLRAAADSHDAQAAGRAGCLLGDVLAGLGEFGAARARYRRVVLQGEPAWSATAAIGSSRLRSAGATSLNALLRHLDAESADRRWQAAEALSMVEGAVVTSALIRHLDDEHALVRQACVRALADRRSDDHVDLLIARLGDPNADVRWTAADVLAGWGDLGADKLINALLSARPSAAMAAIVLQKMNDAVVPTLAAALDSDNQLIRMRAGDALAAHGAVGLTTLLDRLQSERQWVQDAVGDALVRIGDAAVDPLVARLSARNASVRAKAANVLGDIGDARALPALARMLSDADEVCAASAADALAALGPESLQVLMSALRSPAAGTRAAARRSAVAIGGPAVPGLGRLAAGASPGRDEALLALREIGNLPAVFHLAELGQLTVADVEHV